MSQNKGRGEQKFGNAMMVSETTIRKMKENGAPKPLIKFAEDTKNSLDASDVAEHRHLIKQYNPSDPYRHVNNLAVHPRDYNFQTGPVTIPANAINVPPGYQAGQTYNKPQPFPGDF